MKNHYDTIIIGAGAAGLFCAFNIANNKRVLVLDHANKVGKKILMSGGGRCNFTNLNTLYDDFTSENPHFVKSALNQYTAYDFLSLVESHDIEYVEKDKGQLFCKHSSKDILKMLLDECAKAGVKIFKKCEVNKITKDSNFDIVTNIDVFSCDSLVIATGGLSIPTLGASAYGYTVAEQFGHKMVSTKASLVPFTLPKRLLSRIKELAGVSLRVSVSNNKYTIEDDMLFTHRGLSGPAILKLSAYWNYGEEIEIDLLPSANISDYFKSERLKHPDKLLVNSLSAIIPKRVAEFICEDFPVELKLKQLDKPVINKIHKAVHNWCITPSGTEGYRTAEVTSGGISTEQISSKTLESKIVDNLYFIGEVLDVTGQLGGYNFQWAWSSAWCAAQAIK
ncbi:MAG: NAD(P)/FAD-dependent oxidoreductase [Gammaproteobacteria bacterium]|nr:NAD(P)/FAD-dependent oxidoreductase [Gammaproteobacteria bacterium]